MLAALWREIVLSEEILRADSALRRKTVIVLGMALVLAILALFLFQRWLIDSIVSLDVQAAVVRMRGVIGVALTASAICLAVLAAYAARKGTQARATARWPLAGARVLLDTPIRRGSVALRIGRWLQFIAGVLAVLAIATGAVSWRLFNIPT